MAEPRPLGPHGMYGILNAIENEFSESRWLAAEKWSEDAGDEVRRQISSGPNKAEWRPFAASVYQLHIAIKAKDEGGCAEMLSELRTLLKRVAGSEIDK